MTLNATISREPTAEEIRLGEDARRERFWKLWGTYLSERQWGTVREDYSADGDVWKSFTFDQARSRSFRWGEDGLLGLSDRFGRLCFGLALWNGKDPILKERLFGLTGPQGNHGEDVKELYYYLDATPTHSYAKGLYKYPQAEFPYAKLVSENAGRSRDLPEYELLDTGVFDQNRYFDVQVEYAKESIKDILIRITVTNHGPETAPLTLLPTLWYRNTWAWGKISEECTTEPEISLSSPGVFSARHEAMGEYLLACGQTPDGKMPEFLFTHNETNCERLYGSASRKKYTKDAFHDAVIHNKADAVNPEMTGTKAAARYDLSVPAGGSVEVRLRLADKSEWHDPSFDPLGDSHAEIFALRIAEAEEFHSVTINPALDVQQKLVIRQAYAGLLWSKQFYNFVQTEWAQGDSTQPAPPPGHAARNADWKLLFNRDILSMPDTWEYPYYCSWDLAFHTTALSRVDPEFCKDQLILLLREWYTHTNGQMPAYEWNFSDVNPPVHAWAALKLYRQQRDLGRDDPAFLERVFQKLLLNFNWWVNRKDSDGNNLFEGGFLGFDNISVFDRSKPLPTGGRLKQADGSSWMAFYCMAMLQIALTLAEKNPVYEDMGTKFINHFTQIVIAMNDFCGTGLWNEDDGFYYDLLELPDGEHVPIKVRSIEGFMPLVATTIVTALQRSKNPGFENRLIWAIKNRPVLGGHLLLENKDLLNIDSDILLTSTPLDRLEKMLRYLFDQEEFLSPHGIRSVSKFHEKSPYTYTVNGTVYSVGYEPGEGRTGMFGGNSNWRGPIWLPINFMLIQALHVYDRYYGEDLKVEFPTGSGNWVTLGEAARLLSLRVASIFLPDSKGHRPVHGGVERYASDPAWKDLILFYEYFHGDTGRGCGASHQTGWTALVSELLQQSV
jgi:Glycosyl hydrolase family 63 C-terminal domain